MPNDPPGKGKHRSTPGLHKLRPAKVRNALRRRWFEYQVPRHLQPSAMPGLIDMGSDYGGWTIPGGLIEPSWVCYCVGAGGDISFDMELIQHYGVTVRSFDAVDQYVTRAVEQSNGEPRFSAFQAAVATSNGPVRMQVTHDPDSQSVSPAGLYDSCDFIELPGRTLPSLLGEMGDEKIDLLKLDIEGGEYAVIPSLDLHELGVKVFATQLHHTGSVTEAHRLIAKLRDDGYEPVACRPAVKIAFARRDLVRRSAHGEDVTRPGRV